MCVSIIVYSGFNVCACSLKSRLGLPANVVDKLREEKKSAICTTFFNIIAMLFFIYSLFWHNFLNFLHASILGLGHVNCYEYYCKEAVYRKDHKRSIHSQVDDAPWQKLKNLLIEIWIIHRPRPVKGAVFVIKLTTIVKSARTHEYDRNIEKDMLLIFTGVSSDNTRNGNEMRP